MKVTRLQAERVHGYLPIDIEFFPDLTFLTGLNGSGKTSALRILMGLLAPNLEELAEIRFSAAAATVADGNREIVLRAVRDRDGLTLSTSEVNEHLSITAAELELMSDIRHREEHRPPVYDKVTAHPVFQSIARMSTPMFLGLDRRLQIDQTMADHAMYRIRRRDVEYRRMLMGDVAVRGSGTAVLSDVGDLVSATLTEVRAAQEQLDERLRNQILLDSFRYKPVEPATLTSELPNRASLNKFKARQAAIEKAAAGLRLPAGELQSSLSDFFERINQVVDTLEKGARTVQQRKQSKTSTKMRASKKEGELEQKFVVEWVMNRSQADRIFKQIQLLDQYVTDRAKLHETIDRFLELTNGFLAQTHKRVRLADQGALVVMLDGTSSPRPLHALSSGERQLVVMLAHLSLNKRLAGSGVFIVDEPELSLHIGWQERFVDAIQKANPNVQLIMATHSPAIILEKDEHCVTMSEGNASLA